MGHRRMLCPVAPTLAPSGAVSEGSGEAIGGPRSGRPAAGKRSADAKPGPQGPICRSGRARRWHVGPVRLGADPGRTGRATSASRRSRSDRFHAAAQRSMERHEGSTRA
jgi:hypothetical protein